MNPRKISVLTRAVFLAAIAGASAPATLRADIVETISGSVIHGRVLATEAGVVKVETDFAGVLEIKQAQIKLITTEEPVFVALKDGHTLSGRLESTPAGLRVASATGELITEPGGIEALWRPGEKSPAEKAADALRRKWTYEMALDLNGRSGNSDRVFFGTSGKATMETPSDRLTFFANYSQAEENDAKTQDEAKGGVDFTNFFSERLSWYVRTELGFDGTKDLDLRSQSAVGIGYSIIKKPQQTLEARAGLSYRFEDYGTGEDFDSAGLDLGLMHTLDARWGRLRNAISITPAFDDLSNFVLVHDSSLEMPVKTDLPWRLRVGVKTDYTSEPPAGLEELDWTYYTQVVFAWR